MLFCCSLSIALHTWTFALLLPSSSCFQKSPKNQTKWSHFGDLVWNLKKIDCFLQLLSVCVCFLALFMCACVFWDLNQHKAWYSWCGKPAKSQNTSISSRERYFSYCRILVVLQQPLCWSMSVFFLEKQAKEYALIWCTDCMAMQFTWQFP